MYRELPVPLLEAGWPGRPGGPAGPRGPSGPTLPALPGNPRSPFGPESPTVKKVKNQITDSNYTLHIGPTGNHRDPTYIGSLVIIPNWRCRPIFRRSANPKVLFLILFQNTCSYNTYFPILQCLPVRKSHIWSASPKKGSDDLKYVFGLILFSDQRTFWLADLRTNRLPHDNWLSSRSRIHKPRLLLFSVNSPVLHFFAAS